MGSGVRRRATAIVVTVMLAAYAGIVAFVVLSPARVDGDGMPVYRALSRAYSAGLPRWITYPVIETAANVLIMLPIGLLLALLLPARYWWIAVLACSALSLAVEGAQLLLPNRMASTADWMANSAGAAIGAALTIPFRRTPAAEGVPRDIEPPPSIRRVEPRTTRR